MVSAVALLSLLGAAALAGVSSAPVAKDAHVEEMVSRCIVEVLLNGLSKPNAPPIDPMCRELLKKSNQRKQGEKNVGKDINFGIRQLSELEELENPPGRTVKEDDLNEDELKRQTGGGQRNPEEGKHKENGDQQVLSQGSPYSDDKAHKEEKKNDDEKNGEEDGSKSKSHGEEGSIEKKHSEEVGHELLDKTSFPTAGREVVSNYKRSGNQRHSEKSAQSQGKGNQASEEEDREEKEEESSEKYHHSLHQEYEDSFEREEADTEKRGHKPKHYYRKPSLGNSSENKRHRNEEKVDSPEESSEEETNFWAKRNHYPKHHHYGTGHHYEKRNSNEMQDSVEMKGRSRSKEYQDRWHYNREDDEEEDMRHHSMENEEKQPHHERNRPHVESQKEMRHYEERNPPSKTLEDEGRQHSSGRRDEKMHQNNKKRHFQWEETPKPQSVERGEEEPDLYSPEEGFNFREEKRKTEKREKERGEEEPDLYSPEEGFNFREEKREKERGEEEPDLYSPEEGFNFREEKRKKEKREKERGEEEPDLYSPEEGFNFREEKGEKEKGEEEPDLYSPEEGFNFREEKGEKEKVEEEPDLYSPEEGFNFREEKRYYPGADFEEEPDKRHHIEGEEHGSNKRTLLVEEGYPRSHYLVENVKRAAPSFIPYYQQLRWKNRHIGKKDDIGDPFLESDEEPRSHLNERYFFPEYNDDDYWEKKQLMDSLNPKHNEHNLERKHKFDMKRQYNRMDELAHLLNYRKKSAEFPELYNLKEDMKKGHVIRGEGKLGQRPLTPQEEKELENLAAMDLELQKIAEKFSNNQRG